MNALTKFRPFLNFVKKNGVKSFFVAVDDMRLYNFHKKEYDGITKVVFESINFVEEKQWSVIGLGDLENDIEEQVQNIPNFNKYNQYSNPTFLSKERKNNLFIDNTLDYFIFYVPLTIILVFIFNRIFYLLFNF